MEQVNNKNKRLTVIVGALLLVIGISFAYFIATTLINGNGASTKITTARINGATIQVDGNIEFEDLDILPGHKNISSVKLTVTGNNQTVPYNLIWQGTNSLNTPLNYTVYKTSNEVITTSSCSNKTSVVNGMQVLSEECTISNIDQLGSIIASGTINKSEAETKVVLVQDEMIQATKSGAIVYYYVILEYPNLDESQDIDMGGTFEGVVTVEGSIAQADISIVGIYQEQEDKSYTQVNEIPSSTSSYILDEERSSCTNNAEPIWNKEDWSLEVNNLNTSGTDCNLYFKKKLPPSAQTMNKLGVEASTVIVSNGQFTAPETGAGGIYSISDDNGTSYFYRGAVTNNYIKFANFCWRIIRINGDGSIRMIYDGTTCHANGQSTTNSIAISNIQYNKTSDDRDDNAHVGYMYGTIRANTYSEAHKNTNNSTVKSYLDTWYNNNIASYSRALDLNAGYCNDRTINRGSSSWMSGDTKKGYATYATAYAPYNRVSLNDDVRDKLLPILYCLNSRDFFTSEESNKGNKKLTKPIGLITMDEVIFAGGFVGKENKKYYLYNGQTYWTISPSYLINNWANMYVVSGDGNLTSSYVDDYYNIRPVINLRPDITFSSGNGEQNTPFVVAD